SSARSFRTSSAGRWSVSARRRAPAHRLSRWRSPAARSRRTRGGLLGRPYRSLLRLRHRREPFVDELLQAAPLVGLGRIDVALRVDGDAVDREPLARLPAAVAEAGEDLHAGAIEDVDLLVLAVGQEQVLLLRILRERDVPHRSVAERRPLDEHFLHERSVRLEDLDAVVRPIADVDEAVVRQLRAVHRRSELLDRRHLGIVVAEVRVLGLVAVRAPVALELAGFGVDDDDALVAVAVGDV